MVVEITPEKGGTTMKLKKLLALTLTGAVLTVSLTACTPLDAAELVYDSIFGGGSSSTGSGNTGGTTGSGSTAEEAENRAVAEGVAARFKNIYRNATVSYGVPELTSTIQPKFTPDWFRKDRNGNIYALNRTFLTDSGLTLDDFLRNSLVAYKESNFASFYAFDSTGMSAGAQAEQFEKINNNTNDAPKVTVYAEPVRYDYITKLRVEVCHKTVAGREYCLVVVVGTC